MKKHTGRNIFLLVFLLLALGAAWLLSSLNELGERYIRKVLREKILKASDSIYSTSFTRLSVDLFSGRVILDSFELIPDTQRYKRIRDLGQTGRALYRLTLASVEIDKVRLWQIWTKKRVNFRQVTFRSPVLSIIGYPDTVTEKQRRWKVVYEDLYPAVSGIFRDFHIDSVKVENGTFLGSFIRRGGGTNEGAYRFSAALRDVSVNPFSYYNRDRVFYSRDVDLVVHNFEYTLADSLYTLHAGEIGFSLTRSYLYGKNVSLVPDLTPGDDAPAELFRFDLPGFFLSGVNLSRVMSDRQVHLDTIALNELSVKVFRNTKPRQKPARAGKGMKATLAGLYPVVARELKFIRIDTVILSNGNFSYYGSLHDPEPELRIGRVDVGLRRFLLDSLSYSDTSRIFYSKGIELNVSDFSLALRDRIHYIHASDVNFSTRRSRISVSECFLFPDRRKNDARPSGPGNLLDIKVPRLDFHGIDLKRVFNQRHLIFSRLDIGEPDLYFSRLKPSSNPSPRFRTARDFFSEENEEIVFDLLKKYLWLIRGDSILLKQGFAKFVSGEDPGRGESASAGFDLTMYNVRIDSVHGLNRQGYFYSEDFDLSLNRLAVESNDGSRSFSAGRILVATRDSLIRAISLNISRINNYLRQGGTSPVNHQVRVSFSVDSLRLNGLNHKMLFLEKLLRAGEIIMVHPTLKAWSAETPAIPAPAARTGMARLPDIVTGFEVGRFTVRKGSADYHGDGGGLASFFSVRDIDFSVLNSRVDLPLGGQRGNIRFDSVLLNVYPFRAVLADSTYLLQAGKLDIRSSPLDIRLRDIRLDPLHKKNDRATEHMIRYMKISELAIEDFALDSALFLNHWHCRSISLSSPSLGLQLQGGRRGPGDPGTDPDRWFRFPAFIKNLDIGRISINNAGLDLGFSHNGEAKRYELKGLTLEAEGFHYDSLTRHGEGSPFLLSRDITITIPGFDIPLRDSLYLTGFREFRLSTGKAEATVDSVYLKPSCSQEEFYRRIGKQTDIVTLLVPEVKFIGLDLRALLRCRLVSTGSIRANNVTFHSFRDKRVPEGEQAVIPMPVSLVGRSPVPVIADSLVIRNGYLSYREQTGGEPGTVFFSNASLVLTSPGNKVAFGNPPVSCPGSFRRMEILAVEGSASMMGVSEVMASARFFPGHPRDSFTLRATIAPLHLKTVNTMLEKLEPVSIHSGRLSDTGTIRLEANNIVATGESHMAWNNLAVKFRPVKPGTWPAIESALVTEIANLVLPSQNPGPDGRTRKGIIYYYRDPYRGFFNFVWKSTLSGLKSGIGVETKEQKQIRRQTKKTSK